MSMRFPLMLMTTAWLAVSATGSASAEPPSRSISTGVVMAKRAVDIATKRQERITAIHVDRGDRVAADALLIETDADELLADKAAAEAELGAAQVERDYRARSADRLERLARSESLAEDRLDEARYGLAAAEQRLRLAEARLRKIDALLKDRRLTAPFAGIITARAAELGQLTRPGEPLLRLEDHSALELHTRVKERDVPRIGPGDPVRVTIDALDGMELRATVNHVIPSGDADHTFLVEIDLPRQDGLYPGMFGKAVFGE
jgi:membrane fusion protein (multidrug efflux system)